jgi:hypothetical protein
MLSKPIGDNEAIEAKLSLQQTIQSLAISTAM